MNSLLLGYGEFITRKLADLAGAPTKAWNGDKRMDREEELAIVRRAYAKQIMAVTGTEDARVEAAFAEVRREHFLGNGPWQILHWSDSYRRMPSADPVYL